LRLTSLTARGFRNLTPEPVFFGAGTTLIAGENAQGKTNLLEAIALACGQRSFRRARLSEMAADGNRFRVEAVFGSEDREGRVDRLTVAWSAAEGRSFSRGGKTISFREASAAAPAVFFAPEHRELLVGSPALRRRFLDRLALAARPLSGQDLVRFERALSERNALLTRCRGSEPAAGELEAWTEELISAGCAVRRHRLLALQEWRDVFARLAADSGPEYADIRVDYVAREESEEALRGALERLSQVERRRGHTLAGPHRDDLAWSRGGRSLSSQASAGEIHRTTALVKLAEWATVAQATGARPLFAIDEFDAGLAAGWIEALFVLLPEAETVLLTTASEPARYARRVDHILEIRGGRAFTRPHAVNA
jgi:DNA replication and repair protein RecF